MANKKHPGLAEQVSTLSPVTGDILVFRSDDEQTRDELFFLMLDIKQKLAAEAIHPIMVALPHEVAVESVPKEAFTEQGYVMLADVREWLVRSVPLGKQAHIIQMFDEEFSSNGS